VPYSPEYLRFRSNPMVLNQIAERTGGRVLAGTETGGQIYGEGRKPKESSRPVFDWFLMLLAMLVPLDVGLRRVQIDPRVLAEWLGLRRRKPRTTETIGALLQVKQKIKFEPEKKAKEKDLVSPPAAKAPRTRAKKEPGAPAQTAKEEPKAKKPEAPELKGLSTTERLLRMRKKWKKEDHE
jgi:hypothetical protein